jgi:sporulation integral membrane protein YtvI
MLHLRKLISSLGSYLKAEVILVMISFIITIIGLFIMNIRGLNVQYPLLAALVIGFVDALPILGSGTVIVPWAVISALDGDIELALALLILLAVISIVRQFIEPKVVSKQIGIHPIFTLIAMYTGFKVIGIIGLLLGPIILIIINNAFGNLIDRGVVKTIFDKK